MKRKTEFNVESLIEALEHRKEIHLISNNLNPSKQAIADELDSVITLIKKSSREDGTTQNETR